VSKFELTKTQFQRTVKDKIVGKTHLKWENYCFKDIFGILIKFPIQWHKESYEIWYSQGEKRCQSLNWQKYSLKGQSGTKSRVKPTSGEKITDLSRFLKFS